MKEDMGNPGIRRCFIKDLLMPPECSGRTQSDEVNMLMESAFVQ